LLQAASIFLLEFAFGKRGFQWTIAYISRFPSNRMEEEAV